MDAVAAVDAVRRADGQHAESAPNVVSALAAISTVQSTEPIASSAMRVNASVAYALAIDTDRAAWSGSAESFHAAW